MFSYFSRKIDFDISCKLSQIISDWLFCTFCDVVAKITYELNTKPPSPPTNPLPPSNFLLTVPRRCFCLWFTISVIVPVCLYMYVLVKLLFWIAVWPIFGKETVLLASCLLIVVFLLKVLWCLGRKVIGNCIDSCIIAFLSI